MSYRGEKKSLPDIFSKEVDKQQSMNIRALDLFRNRTYGSLQAFTSIHLKEYVTQQWTTFINLLVKLCVNVLVE